MSSKDNSGSDILGLLSLGQKKACSFAWLLEHSFWNSELPIMSLTTWAYCAGGTTGRCSQFQLNPHSSHSHQGVRYVSETVVDLPGQPTCHLNISEGSLLTPCMREDSLSQALVPNPDSQIMRYQKIKCCFKIVSSLFCDHLLYSNR